MWFTSQKRFVRHVCFRNPFPPFLLGIPSIHSLPEASGPWERQHAPPALHYGCIMPIPLLQLQEKHVLCREEKGFGHGVLVSKICYNAVIVLSVVLCDCCKPMHNCWDWAFSNSGLEVGLPAYQLPTFAKCETLPQGDLWDMFVSGIHSRHSFLDFQASTPYQKLERQLCIMVASCPSLRCICRKKPVSCSEAEGLVKELWFPRFVTMQWLCSQLRYETAANQPTLVEIELLATVGWKWGCQPFSCRCSLNVAHCRKEIYATCLFQESIPAILFGNSKHPLPTVPEAWAFGERQHAPPALHYGCIMLAKDRVMVSKIWTRTTGYWLWSRLPYIWYMRLLQVNEELSRFSF